MGGSSHLHTVFFGLDILVFAYLVLRSAFLPIAIGFLLAIDGLAYLCYSFTDILAPGSRRPPGPLDPTTRPGW